MKKTLFTVTGMSCAACSASVERAVNNLEGVVSASVNLTSGKLSVIYNEETLSQKDIEDAVTRIGFGVNYDSLEANLHKKTREVYIMKKKLIFSACFAIPLFYISMGHMVGLPVPGFMNPQSNGIVFALVQMLLGELSRLIETDAGNEIRLVFTPINRQGITGNRLAVLRCSNIRVSRQPPDCVKTIHALLLS